ncbi:kinase-like domain-containing protein, partial [Powellomyces hirtus]
FLEHYFDLLKYLDDRKARLHKFRTEAQNATGEEAQRGWKNYCKAESDKLRRRRCRPRIANFAIIKQVGQGGYGQVFLARQNDTKEICALKKMSKHLLANLGEINHILTERDILTRTSTPWLVKLLYSFQDSEHVFLAMEYVAGGDMRTLLNNSGVLREVHARFYVAEMSVAVAELHTLGFIHRDLKPENFLIDAKGHLKLTDFGLSRGWVSGKVVEGLKIKLDKIKNTQPTKRSTYERRSIHQSMRREDMLAYSLVGSPDYMAPEVLTNNQEGYGLAVDYWSIGCILFECLAGYPPFTAPTTDDVWVNVYNWKEVLARPQYTGADEEFNLSDTAWSLVESLLTTSDTRLQTPSALQSHAFFLNHPFTNLRNSPHNTPPFIPTLRAETDTSYFDDFTDENDMAMYKEVRDRMREVAGKNCTKKNGAGKSEGATKRMRDKEIRDAFVGFTFRHAGWEGAVEEQHQGTAFV